MNMIKGKYIKLLDVPEVYLFRLNMLTWNVYMNDINHFALKMFLNNGICICSFCLIS